MSELTSLPARQPRRVDTTWRSRPAIEGAGVYLQRAFGNGDGLDLDPFLLLDDFRGDRPERYLAGFPTHPHRGMETITYVLEGNVEHTDSLGNGGNIGPGDVQWMTAGSGILHQEMPKGDSRGRMDGFQLWANLPRDHKMTSPGYREVPVGTIPVLKQASGAELRVISGVVDGSFGPVRDTVTDVVYLDVTLPAGTLFEHDVEDGHTLFAYVIEGEGNFAGEGGQVSDNGTLVAFERDGRLLSVSTEAKPVRFLLVSGSPLREPIAWGGPIVMNSEAELRTAFQELQNGTFIKHPRE